MLAITGRRASHDVPLGRFPRVLLPPNLASQKVTFISNRTRLTAPCNTEHASLIPTLCAPSSRIPQVIRPHDAPVVQDKRPLASRGTNCFKHLIIHVTQSHHQLQAQIGIDMTIGYSFCCRITRAAGFWTGLKGTTLIIVPDRMIMFTLELNRRVCTVCIQQKKRCLGK